MKKSTSILISIIALLFVAILIASAHPWYGLASRQLADPNFHLPLVARGVTPTPTLMPMPEPTVGLIVRGEVLLENRNGLEGVAIYRAYASYPGVVIATTQPDGSYDSGYYWIPGDEMVRVWAVKDGYELCPRQYYWRHYHGFEVRTRDFTAYSLAEPPATPYCPP